MKLGVAGVGLRYRVGPAARRLGGGPRPSSCWLTVWAVLVGGCANLPEIAAGECGNAVVDPAEDCDTFSPEPGLVCRPKGAVGECRLDCRRGVCPLGWGCDADQICREPTGEFSTPSGAGSTFAGAWSLLAGDFDGDRRDEVVALEPLDPIGNTKLRIHYFDVNGAVAETRAFPKSLVSPIVVDLSGDGRSDVAFSDFRIGVLLGQADRGLVPETFSSYRVADSSVYTLPLYDGVITGGPGFAILAKLNEEPGYYVVDTETALLRSLGPLARPVEELVGSPDSGAVIDEPIASPCREGVLAFRGDSAFSLINACIFDAVTGEVRWRDQVEEFRIPLDPPQAIDTPPRLNDLNSDGHLDVLVGAQGMPYVAYGDGLTLSTATPYQLPFGAAEEEVPLPLAALDYTADGAVDFVFGDRLLVSTPGSQRGLPSYQPAYINVGSPWTLASIADFNGNNRLDVVLASNNRLNIDFLSGTASQFLNPFFIPTNGPVEHLAQGDFDGDTLTDLAFVEKAPSEDERDTLLIAFGTWLGPPTPPIEVARIRHTQELRVYSEQGLGNLIVSSEDLIDGERSSALTVLGPSGDRLPFAPFELTNFASDGSVQTFGALGLVAGRFTDRSRGDVLALGARDGDSSAGFLAADWGFWLLPAVNLPGSAPVRLDFELDPRLEPVRQAGLAFETDFAGARGDVDGDGLDDAVFALSADGGERCGVIVIGVGAEGDGELAPRQTIMIDEPCAGPEVAIPDADGDGSSDILLLTGERGVAGRKLLMLWNDGDGRFADDDVTSINDDDSPEQVTTLPENASRPFAVAYVTERAVMLATLTERREFSPPVVLRELAAGSGIVAADINGDRVTDLAIAESGNLTILEAELKTP